MILNKTKCPDGIQRWIGRLTGLEVGDQRWHRSGILEPPQGVHSRAHDPSRCRLSLNNLDESRHSLGGLQLSQGLNGVDLDLLDVIIQRHNERLLDLV